MNNPVSNPPTVPQRVEAIANLPSSPGGRNWSPDVPIYIPNPNETATKSNRSNIDNSPPQEPINPLQSNRAALQAAAASLPAFDMQARLRLLIEEVLNPPSS